MKRAKKNPGTGPGLEAFFAVTHQGPAQGGKAGGGEPPGAKSNKKGHRMQARGTNGGQRCINRPESVQSWHGGGAGLRPAGIGHNFPHGAALPLIWSL